MTKSALLLVFALLATTTFAFNATCLGYNDTLAAVFEIDSLYNNASDYEYNVTSSTVLRYNYCHAVKSIGNCSTDNVSAVVQQQGDTSSCIKLTNGIVPKYYAQDINNPLGGISLVYPLGDQVSNSNARYNYTVALSCVDNGTYNVTSVNISGNNSEYYLVNATGHQGCPYFAFYQLSNFVTKYKVAFIIAGIVIGVFVGFFGLRLFKPTLFLTAFVVVFLIIAFIFFTLFLGNNPSAGAQWGCLIGAIAIGVLAGVLAVYLEKVGIFCLGAWLGVTGSFLLYSLILSHLNAGRLVLILFSVGSALICGVLALCLFEHAIIIATALGGAYIAIRGVSLFAPPKYSYPNEIEIAREIQYNGFSNIPGIFYLYFALIVVLAAGGAFLQYRHKRARDQEKEQEENPYQGLAYHSHP